MKMKLRLSTFVVFGISFFAFLCGGTWTFIYSKAREKEAYEDLEKFIQVYDLVKKNYVKDPEDEILVDGAIQGMLDDLDPHSVYLSKKDFTEMQADTKGEYGGLGIEISKRDDALTVVAPMEDTPASRAGLQAGDIIVKIEDKPTAKMTIFEAVDLMKGKPGTKVNLTIKRESKNEFIPVTIKRAIIKVKSVRAETKEGFPVIRIRQFAEKTADQLREIIKKFKKDGPVRGMVLDLRNNPGGLLTQAVEVADIFLPEGMIVYTKGREDDQVAKSFAMSKGTEPNYPIVVLVNGGSASASEIVAGALQDHKRAHIIGTQSFGKGSVQNVIPLGDGSGVKLTVALYYTPSGKQIQGEGIKPNEIVRGPNDPEEMPREKDLPNHIIGQNETPKKEESKSKKKDGKSEVSKTKPSKADENVDVQLDRAILYLKQQQAKAETPKK